MTRPPIERYVRLIMPFGGIAVEPGLEWRPDTDDTSALCQRLRQVTDAAMYRATRECAPIPDWEPSDFAVITRNLEEAVREYWPDRAWFVEVYCDAGWVQIFQPYGVPRNS